MEKKKIAVYAICKNEEQFVERFMNSVKEADEVIILDTGSEDQTVQKLKDLGATVYQEEIRPWRFDVARNHSLEHVPDDIDICVCIDLDEVLENGWRNEVEKSFDGTVDRIRYPYNWSFDEYQKPKIRFYTDKIHTRKNYHWTHPVHEILIFEKEGERIGTCDTIECNHYPDHSKSRGQYLPLLELSVQEDPTDDRNMHYLGREYMYYGQWEKCIETLQKHLSLPKATWNEERCASMRFIARSYHALNQPEEAKKWFLKAINEAPYLRDGYVEYAMLAQQEHNYKEVIQYLEKALQIQNRGLSYINEPFSWDSSIYDMLSIAYFYNNQKELSLQMVEKAFEMDPNNERIKQNRDIIRENQ